MNDEQVDRVHLLPPIRAGGSDVSLKIEFLGTAWVDGRYVKREEKLQEILLAISKLKNILIEHGRG